MSATSLSPGNAQLPWWQAYQQGVDALERGHYEAAAVVFRDLAGITADDAEPRAVDLSQRRTYGMRFASFYPVRELGICHFYLGNRVLARKYLILSQRQAPSSRAQQYFDKVQRMR